MKTLIAIIVLAFATVAPAQTYDATLDRLQADNLAQRDELIATRAELQQVKLKAATAIEENIKQNEAFHGELQARDKVIKKQSKTLDKWYVKAVLWLANFVIWLAGIAAFLYGLALFGGFLSPHTIVFRVAQWLIKALPGGNFIDNFHPTTTVRAITTPVVEPPAVVTPPVTDPAVVANLAAMAEAKTAVTKPVDLSSSIAFTHAKP